MKAFIFRISNEIHLVYAENEDGAYDELADTMDEEDIEEGELSPLPASDVPASFVLCVGT